MKPKVKHPYRSSIQIIKQIIEVIINGGRDGISVSVIARNSGTSHVSVLEKCQKLVNAGLLKTRIDHKSRKYYATEEGIKFFAMLTKYEELLQVINNR